MTKTLLHPGYFGPIDQFCVMAHTKKIVWENEDNYQKQTYRTRQYIYGANGKMLLNIPILHTHKNDGRQQYKEVKIENQFNWQKEHWKSLESAYRNSPFFEFYEDELHLLYSTRFTFLIDFNYRCIEAVLSCLSIGIFAEKTDEYIEYYNHKKDYVDFRHLIEAKRPSAFPLSRYSQVFLEKHGFIPNLSILDLLFNEGPQAKDYLKNNFHAEKR